MQCDRATGLDRQAWQPSGLTGAPCLQAFNHIDSVIPNESFERVASQLNVLPAAAASAVWHKTVLAPACRNEVACNINFGSAIARFECVSGGCGPYI